MSDSLADSPCLLLYGVLNAAARDDDPLLAALDRPGVREAPLSLLSCDPLSVLISPVDDPAALRHPDVEQVLAYNEIIEAAYEIRPLLPLRFGTRAETPEAARRLVRKRADACTKQLAHLSGRVEMGIRLQLPSASEATSQEAAAEAESGAAYLQARKAAYARTQRPLREGVRACRKALADLWVDASHSEPDPEERALSAAFLVPRPDVDAFVRRAETVDIPSEVQDVQIVGPWAPFTFASLSL